MDDRSADGTNGTSNKRNGSENKLLYNVMKKGLSPPLVDFVGDLDASADFKNADKTRLADELLSAPEPERLSRVSAERAKKVPEVIVIDDDDEEVEQQPESGDDEDDEYEDEQEHDGYSPGSSVVCLDDDDSAGDENGDEREGESLECSDLAHESLVLEDSSADLQVNQSSALSFFVFFRGETHSFELNENDHFEPVFKFLAQKVNVVFKRIAIFKDGEMLRPNDTPKTVCLRSYDYLEADVKPELPNDDMPEDTVPEDCIKLRFQTSDRSSILRLTVRKSEAFSKILEAYVAREEAANGRIQLYFDGEPIDSDETPADLDLESDDVIDVVSADL